MRAIAPESQKSERLDEFIQAFGKKSFNVVAIAPKMTPQKTHSPQHNCNSGLIPSLRHRRKENE